MNRIHRVDPIVVPFRDNPDLAYAAKHLEESCLAFHGIVTLDHYRKGELIHTQTGGNIFTTEGRNHLLDIIFRAQTTNAAIYMGIFKSNQVPAAADTAAAKIGSGKTYDECLDADYTPNTNRPAYTIAAAGSSICTNAASPAVFTIVAASITIYGAFLCNVATKTASTGVLICAKAF
jgi:hypothetical protein